MASIVYKEMKEKMGERIDSLKEQYGKMRAGRANPQLVENILVDYYGAPTPIVQMASIAVMEARIIEIQPYDASSLKAIEKAINISDLGIPPQNDGKSIRVIFPQLTEDTRKSLAKDIRKLAEEAKVGIRNIRREGNEMIKQMEKDSDLTEDEQRRAEGEVQEITDKHTEEIDKIADNKEKEIMSV